MPDCPNISPVIMRTRTLDDGWPKGIIDLINNGMEDDSSKGGRKRPRK